MKNSHHDEKKLQEDTGCKAPEYQVRSTNASTLWFRFFYYPVFVMTSANMPASSEIFLVTERRSRDATFANGAELPRCY
jgi:hypothetical protein